MSQANAVPRTAALNTKPGTRKAFHRALDAVTNIKYEIGKPSQLRWVCYHNGDRSDIDAWVPVTEHLETIATAHAIEGVDARANAELIVNAVNSYHHLQPTISELLNMVERWLTDECLSPFAKSEANLVLRRAKRTIGAG